MPNLTIVYGPPCSGKSIYVSEQIKDNDIRFDYDLIIQSISNRKSHNYSDTHLPYVMECREMIINKSQDDQGIENVYIIATKITDKLKEELNGFDAVFKLVETSKEECYNYLENDDTREDKDFWKEKIDDWFLWHENYLAEKEVTNNKMAALKVKNKTADSAELYIYGDIVDNTDWKWDEFEVMPDDVKSILDEINETNKLDIYINSGGGSVYAGLAICNMLKRHKAYKTVYVDGIAASIASAIALTGDRIVIPSNAYFMVHKAWTGGYGNSTDMRKLADTLDKIDEGILNTYKEKLREGVDIDTIKQMVDAETWLTGEEVAEYFNTEVTSAVDVAASTSDYYAKYRKTPVKIVENSKDIEPHIVPRIIENKEPEPQNNNEEAEKQKLLMELDLI